MGLTRRGAVMRTLFRQEEASINNLFTGVRLRGVWSKTMVVGGLLLGGLMSMKENYINTPRNSNVVNYGNLPMLSYDAVPNRSRLTGSRDLGATGEIVFGLNSARRGGL